MRALAGLVVVALAVASIVARQGSTPGQREASEAQRTTLPGATGAPAQSIPVGVNFQGHEGRRVRQRRTKVRGSAYKTVRPSRSNKRPSTTMGSAIHSRTRSLTAAPASSTSRW